ncbi:NADH-quinone oxidoreductase subunit L [Symmachiella macrocystis]|uniref:Probable inorganic carbon transporter subunit DabB n=1 Tax=Symmachiella macrocystis TaxID=2527985 RepID=A0A5C6BSN3_9PLAN|nr:proton-conducting transporter membrane subunit [Symmachiella macrocystis]TWU13889.1 NADH-quinone oxidoreductase subunit L [Symmachiella macrocystis]
MQTVIAATISIPIWAMLSAVLLNKSWANRHATNVIWTLNSIAAINAVAALLCLVFTINNGPLYLVLFDLGQDSLFKVSLYLDTVSALMLSLVAGLGWVICKFSIRYLDAEKNQGEYFRWTAFTIGAVSLVVAAGNLAMMLVALLLTSLGLHQLLVHYSERPAAHRAASIKFIFSRVGDLCLLLACILLYGEFGSLELPILFSKVGTLDETGIANSDAIQPAGWLLALCAVFKSAQFPFHSWLPETMEAPTPVSALMHAGIVNAGGYLLIRMAPIVSLTPMAMWAIAGLGAFTAFIAALVMLTQTSVKRTLAWSTISQMGFMMLQCGLGAFSAAMLHIIAHSLYKAHAFLASGSVMSEKLAMATANPRPRSNLASFGLFAASAAISLCLLTVIAWLLGVSLQEKPGGFLLGLIVCLGLTRWMWHMLENGGRFVIPGLAMTTLFIAAYLGSFTAIDALVAENVRSLPMVLSSQSLMFIIAIAYMALFVLDLTAYRRQQSKWLRALYVHSSNGFYVDILWRQLAKSVST